MNKLQIFNKPEFGQMRIIQEGNKILFCASDIAKALGEKKKDQILVGFAAESENLVENAKKKIVSKNLDFIVANDISGKETGFGSDYNAAEIIFNDGRIYEINKMTKRELADIIIDKVMEIKRA